MSIKEQYWKYSLIVIILFMGIIIFRQITPFLGGLLGALTIYILVRTQMTHLTEKWKLKRSVAALLITAETVMNWYSNVLNHRKNKGESVYGTLEG